MNGDVETSEGGSGLVWVFFGSGLDLVDWSWRLVRKFKGRSESGWGEGRGTCC